MSPRRLGAYQASNSAPAILARRPDASLFGAGSRSALVVLKTLGRSLVTRDFHAWPTGHSSMSLS
jgi:hypothetical protein